MIDRRWLLVVLLFAVVQAPVFGLSTHSQQVIEQMRHRLQSADPTTPPAAVLSPTAALRSPRAGFSIPLRVVGVTSTRPVPSRTRREFQPVPARSAAELAELRSRLRRIVRRDQTGDIRSVGSSFGSPASTHATRTTTGMQGRSAESSSRGVLGFQLARR